MARVTQKQLDNVVRNVNRALGRPEAFAGPETVERNGREVPKINVGHIALDQDMTGTKIVEITSEGGAQSEVCPYSMTKSEAEIFLQGMLATARMSR